MATNSEAVRPETVTPLGVIAPKVKVIAGVDVAVATEPDTPLAVTTDTDVTVPAPAGSAKVPSPRKKSVVLFGGVGTAPPTVAVITGKSEFTAALIAVPFPSNTPVIDVDNVIAGVDVAVATVPAKPLAEATETEVTVPTAPVASVNNLPVTLSIVIGKVTEESALDTPSATVI